MGFDYDHQIPNDHYHVNRIVVDQNASEQTMIKVGWPGGLQYVHAQHYLSV